MKELSTQQDSIVIPRSIFHELSDRKQALIDSEEISLELLQYSDVRLLEELIDAGYADQVLSKISSIDTDKITLVAQLLVRTLNREGYGAQLVAKLEPIKITPSLSENTHAFLMEMKYWPDNLEEVIEKIVPFSIFELSDDAEGVLFDFILIGYAKEVLAKCKVVDLSDQSSQRGLPFLIQLISYSLDITPLVGSIDATSRTSITFEKLSPTINAGPTVEGQWKNLPLELPVERKHFGWWKVKLQKTGSETTVFFQENEHGNIYKVLFKNAALGRQSLATYQHAHSLMPGFVSNSSYPELSTETPPIRVRNIGSSFYEVYAGPSLDKIDFPVLPGPLRESILKQVLYIRKTLADNNINHGHPHYRNFNLRCMLTDPSTGKKRVEFDIDTAIQETIDTQGILTPIVVLRDWDQATPR